MQSNQEEAEQVIRNRAKPEGLWLEVYSTYTHATQSEFFLGDFVAEAEAACASWDC